MKSSYTSKELETLAVHALKALLHQLSAVELKEMKLESHAPGRQIEILANVGVYGQSHTLACKVAGSADPSHVRKALKQLHDGAANMAEGATPVFIAPYLSPEARALCSASKTGFLDLEDNARLMLGEVFIGKRSMGRRNATRNAGAPGQTANESLAGKLPQARAAAPSAAHAPDLGCAA
ncbi:MAG: hypothetical protein ACRD3N_15285 [Terracidiphilus sp.]